MDKHDIQELQRARSLAGWSYAGIFIPILGWILGAMSLSALKHIEPKTPKAAQRIRSVKNLAEGGLCLTSMVVVLWIAVGVWVGHQYQEEAERQRVEQQQQEKADENAAIQREVEAQTQRYNRQVELNKCIDGVNEATAKAAKSVYTNADITLLLQFKQQSVQECELKYPID